MYNFVCPFTGTHTQNIESLWNKLKKRLKKINSNNLETLIYNLKEWMWKDNICKDDFSKVLELIKFI